MSTENIIEEVNTPITETVTEIPIDLNNSIVIEEAIEAILFAAGHPITYATLAKVFETTPSKIKDIVFDYALKYNNSDVPRGVILLIYSDSCQLCTKQHYLAEIREALGIRKSGTLSTSALETLAIIAYNQPVTRIFVDTLRKVDSSYAMNSLIDRGLIECKGRLDVPGRPMLYGTTSDFLRCFGLNDLDSLPKTSDELIEVFEGAKAEEEILAKETDDIINGEQLTLDIDEAIDGKGDEMTDEAASEATEVTEAEETVTETVEFDEPSADDDIHED